MSKVARTTVDGIYELLRPHEVCKEWAEVSESKLVIVGILPIYADFRLSLSQQDGVFIFKIASVKGAAYRFEVERVETLQGILIELKSAMAIAHVKAFAEGKSHAWTKHYETLKEAFASQELDIGETVNGTSNNPFLSPDGPSSTRNVKDGWIAKELRIREPAFANYTHLKICTGTWNVNGQSVIESLKPWLNTSNEDEPDVYILGFQEVDLSTEAYLISDTSKDEEWSRAIDVALRVRSERYMKVISKQLIGMLTMVYAKSSIFPFIHDAAAESIGTGLMGMLGNKGAVGVRLKIHDSYLCVVNAHLAADTSMVDRRNQDYAEICKRLVFPLPVRFQDFMAYTVSNPWVCNFIDAAPVAKQAPDNNPASPSFSRAFVTLFDSDHVIFVGDLNYRVNISDMEAKGMIERGELDKLLKYDQLQIERDSGRVFAGFNEGPIDFPPTYKYDVGSDKYDTSEKKRSPSWCDRILYFKNPLKTGDPDWCKLKWYVASQKMLMSDHKPVMALFSLKIRHLNSTLLAKVQQEIIRELDKFENESVPDLVLSDNSIEFGVVKYLNAITKSIVLENKGKVIAQYSFIPKPDESSPFRPWCYVHPSSGGLLPGEKLKLSLTVLVDKKSSGNLNQGIETLDDVLILHIENGKDLFMSLRGEWLQSCFGTSLDILCALQNPIQKYTPKELKAIASQVDKSRALSDSPTDFGSPASKMSVPKEIWRLAEFIYKFGMDVENLFLSSGDPGLTLYFRDCLDTGSEFNLELLLSEESPILESSDSLSEPRDSVSTQEGTLLDIDTIISKMERIQLPKPKGRVMSILSACETLLRLLEGFPEPVVPTLYQKKIVLEGYHTFAAAKQVTSLIPYHHYHTFIYLVSFLRELVCNHQTGQSPEKLSNVFSPLLLPSVSESTNLTNTKKDPKETPESYHRKRTLFLLHFIENQ